MQYFDKNGAPIKAGMTIRMEDGSLELVYDSGHRSCDDRKVIQLYRFQRRMP